MKLQKLLANIVVFWFATVTGTAFANENICDGYFIEDKTFESSVTLNGQSCYLQNVTITGDLTVFNAEKFTVQNSDVSGTIRVIASGDVRVNDSDAGKVILRGNEVAEVTAFIADSAIRVVRNGVAYVFVNSAPIINCRGNTRLVGSKNDGYAGGNDCDSFGLFSPAD